MKSTVLTVGLGSSRHPLVGYDIWVRADNGHVAKVCRVNRRPADMPRTDIQAHFDACRDAVIAAISPLPATRNGYQKALDAARAVGAVAFEDIHPERHVDRFTN